MSLISISVKTIYMGMNGNNLFRRSYMASGFQGCFQYERDQMDIIRIVF